MRANFKLRPLGIVIFVRVVFSRRSVKVAELDIAFHVVGKLIIETIKVAEDEEGIIVRAYESLGQAVKSALDINFDSSSIYECDLFPLLKVTDNDVIKSITIFYGNEPYENMNDLLKAGTNKIVVIDRTGNASLRNIVTAP